MSDLLEKMDKWDAVIERLPAIAARLRSLKALHDRAAAFESRVAELESRHAQMRDALHHTEALASQVQQSMIADVAQVDKNLAALEQRIAKLANEK